FAIGAARIGDSNAIATLGQALNNQKARGYAYYKTVAEAFGAVENPEVVPRLREIFKANPGNNEVARAVLSRLHDAWSLKGSPEIAAFVRDFVLDPSKDWGDDIRARILALLDEVKTKDAKEALAAVAEKSTAERIKANAARVLEQNFPAAAK